MKGKKERKKEGWCVMLREKGTSKEVCIFSKKPNTEEQIRQKARKVSMAEMKVKERKKDQGNQYEAE